MDPLYIASFAAVVIGTGLAVYLLGTRALRSKSYEEVIEEQRGRRDLLLGTEKKITKKKKPQIQQPKVRRRPKPVVKEVAEEEEQVVTVEEPVVEQVDGGSALEKGEDPVEEAPNEQPLLAPIPKRKKHVEISDRESSVEEHQHSPSHNCHQLQRRDSITPILLNKNEASPVSTATGAEEEELNSFERIRPADDAEMMKRRRSVVEEVEMAPQVDVGLMVVAMEQPASPRAGSAGGKAKKKALPMTSLDPPQLLQLISSTPLSPTETSTLIELLLNKHGGGEPDWQSKSSNTNQEQLIRELRERLQESDGNLQQLQMRIRDLRQDLQSEKGKQSNWSKLIERLEKERDEWRGKATSLHHTHSGTITQLQSQLQQSNNNNQVLVKEREALRSASAHLEQQLQLSFGSNQELSNKLKQLQESSSKDGEKHKSELEQLRRRLESEFLEREQHIVEDLKRGSEGLKKEWEYKLQELQSELKGWKCSAGELRQKLQEGETAMTALGKRLREEEDLHKAAEAICKKREEEYRILEAKSGELMEKEKAMMRVNEELQARVKSLELKVEEAKVVSTTTAPPTHSEEDFLEQKRRIEELQVDGGRLRTELASTQSQLTALQEEKGSFMNRLTEGEEKLKELHSSNSKLLQKIEGLEEELSKPPPEAASSIEDPSIQQLQESLSEKDSQLSNYKRVLAETENLLQQLQSSVEEEESKWRRRVEELEEELSKLKTEGAREENGGGHGGAATTPQQTIPTPTATNNNDDSPGKKKKSSLGRLFKK